MRNLNRLVSVFCLVALVGTSSESLFAQLAPPTSPAQRLPNFNIPSVTFVFDSVLDSKGGADPNTLDFTARRITEAHRLAQQQVELAVRFLQNNREAIIRGEIPEFNAIFGDVSQQRPAVVLSSRPVNGLFTIDPANPTVIEFNPNSTGGSVAAELSPGDQIYLVEPSLPGDPIATTGFRGTVQQVVVTSPTDGEAMVILQNGLTSALGLPITSVAAGSGLQVWKVQRVEQRGDPSRFDQVLRTFESIKQALQGSNPNQGRSLVDNPAQPIKYEGQFRAFDSVYGAGQVAFRGLGFQGYPADRRTREAGLSNSDSLQAQQNRLAGGLPLLWTGDNFQSYRSITINNPNSPTIAPTATVTPTPPTGLGPNNTFFGALTGGDRSRTFFFDRQTIFGAPDNPNQQFVGYAFILDRINHSASFADNQVALSSGTLSRTVQALDANGQPVLNTNTGQPTTRMDNLPDVGNQTIQQPKPLADWQDIVKSFAEFSTNINPQLGIVGGAFVGVQDILGTSAAGTLSQFDAGNYALFANFIRSDTGLGAARNSEPFGKRATAGFNPVVPLQ